MHLNSSGNMIQDTLLAMPQYYPGWQTDCFVIMPNHVHAVMVLSNSNEVRVQGPARRPAPTIESNNKIKLLESSIATAISLPELIRNIKSYTTTCYRKGVLTKKWPPFERQLWQRSYYEHIIRNETSLNKIQEYIVQNPAQWDMDRENPSYNVPF
ncbi:MAG: transposase [Gammaproteobacteria bacterium]